MTADLDASDRTATDIHDAVLALAGVAAVGSGRLDQIATYLPGRTVPGVVVGDADVTIEIVGSYPPAGSYMDLAGRVRDRARGFADARAINVVITGIDIPGDDTDQEH